MKDLHSWIGETPELVRIPEPVSVRHEVTAVQHAIEKGSRAPLLFEHPVLLDGRPSSMPLITNVTARRDLLARVLSLPERRTAPALAARLSRPIPPKRVALDSHVKVLANASEILPALWQHDCDPGPYLTAAHATTLDPDTLIDNTAVQRVWVKPGSEWPYFPYPSSHNWRNIEKWWARGEDAPIALWIGHHPAVLMGTQVKLDYPASHWPSAGALLGEGLRLVDSVLHGARIPVPADAEIVIEGFVPRNLRVDEGPFGEFTGYAGEGTKSPVIRVERVAMREDAIYHDFGSGLADALVPDDLLIEAKLYEIALGVTPLVLDVHVPSYGRRFWALVETRPLPPDTARALLNALLEFRRTKFIVLFDEGVDLHDPAAVVETIGTRSQPGRDFVTRSGLAGSSLDPSLPLGTATSEKLGIDATWNGGRRPVVNRVPDRAVHSPSVRAAVERARRVS
ncbi:MAG: UbiD family decarboxylase [Vicinamibacteria bacterium]